MCSVFSEVDPTSVTGNQRYVLRDDIDLCFCTSMELGKPVSKSQSDREYPFWYFEVMFTHNQLEQLKRRLGICDSKSCKNNKQSISICSARFKLWVFLFVVVVVVFVCLFVFDHAGRFSHGMIIVWLFGLGSFVVSFS